MICKICNEDINTHGIGCHIKCKHNLNAKDYDISKPCNLDKDNWKLYEQNCIIDKIIKPSKILDSPELYNAGQIIYKPIR